MNKSKLLKNLCDEHLERIKLLTELQTLREENNLTLYPTDFDLKNKKIEGQIEIMKHPLWKNGC